MASLKIEGDSSQISDQQLTFIKNVIEQRGYKNNKVIIEPVGKTGDNYGANVQRITVVGDKGNDFKIIAKIAPQNEAMRNISNAEHIFLNEHLMYTKILPKLTQLEKAADVPPEERLRYAACYGSCMDKLSEVILLEDLKESNFVMLDRLKPISTDCVKYVLKDFASLHSLCYVLKNKEPEMFEEYKYKFFDTWAQTPEDAYAFFKVVESNLCKNLESDVHKKAINGSLTKCFKTISKMATYERDSSYAVILQGDAWTNNIMFRFKEDKLLESVMIDYQLSRLNSPAADILYMILNCTDYQMRKEHFHDWINYYHSELDKSLNTHGLKASFVYPRDQLDSDLRRYGSVGFGLSVMLVGLLSLNTEEAKELKSAMDSGEVEIGNFGSSNNSDTSSIMKAKIEGLVDSCRELGLI